MGQGGQLVLQNYTAYQWKRTKSSSYQMNNFDLPETVEANTSVSVYIEYDEGIFTTVSDDIGEATYQVDCDGSPSFEICFKYPSTEHDPAVRVTLNFQTAVPSMGSGTVLDVGGWQHDGYMYVTLMGTVEKGFAFANGLSYMQAFIAQGWGSRTLRQLCIIGAHNAGMYEKNGGTAFGTESNTKCQIQNVLGQLQRGTRYFDLRPVITGGKYATGHYSNIGSTLESQGCNGGWMSDIVSHINTFTTSYPELVILKFSASANTDVGRSYQEFSETEWDGLFEILKGLSNLVKMTTSVDLSTQTLESYIGTTAAVVVVVSGTNAKCDPSQGFFKWEDSTFPLYDSYANTNEVDTMITDQVTKFNANHEYFLLSWTLTQSGTQAVLGPSVLDLAKTANKKFKDMIQYCTSTHIPNIFYADRITTGNNEYPILIDVVVSINAQYTGASAKKQVANLCDVEVPKDEEPTWLSVPAPASPVAVGVPVLCCVAALLAAAMAVLHIFPGIPFIGSPRLAAMLTLLTIPVAVLGGLRAWRQHRRAPVHRRLPTWRPVAREAEFTKLKA